MDYEQAKKLYESNVNPMPSLMYAVADKIGAEPIQIDELQYDFIKDGNKMGNVTIAVTEQGISHPINVRVYRSGSGEPFTISGREYTLETAESGDLVDKIASILNKA